MLVSKYSVPPSWKYHILCDSPNYKCPFLGMCGLHWREQVSTWLQNITRDRQGTDVCKRTIDDLQLIGCWHGRNGAFHFKIIMSIFINAWRKIQKLTIDNVRFVVPANKLWPPLLTSASSLDLNPCTWHSTICYNSWNNHSLSMIDVIVVWSL